MSADVDVLVIGAGQAGLAVSHELAVRDVEHVVFESQRVGAAWADRWDSLCLVTPNHTIRLPGGEYRGPDPDGYLPRDDIVAHLRAYADSFDAPVEEGRPVTALSPEDGGFRADTRGGPVHARRVVVCTGAYQREYLPPWTEELAQRVVVVPSGVYRAPASLPDGPVLVIGGGQSAAQISEELRGAGRDVALAAGAAPAMPRRIAGRDGVDWLIDAGFFEHTLADMPSAAVRLAPNPLATGAHGGHDLTLRTLAAAGVTLSGRVTAVDGDRVVVADDLAASVAVGDEAYRQIWNAAATIAAERGMAGPEPLVRDESPLPATPPPTLTELGAVVIACGFRPAYSWIHVPGLVDELGFPVQERGRSIRRSGLFFVGVPWMTSRRSPLFMGVGEDAAMVAAALAA